MIGHRPVCREIKDSLKRAKAVFEIEFPRGEGERKTRTKKKKKKREHGPCCVGMKMQTTNSAAC